jgi:hypothetical protein
MKKFLTFTAIVLFAASCSSDSEGEKVTTEPVVNRTITNISTGSLSNPVEVYFNFETGEVVPESEANTKKWDISFKRPQIRINGGESGPGSAKMIALDADYNTVILAPDSGYITDGQGADDELGGESGLAFNNWYNYQEQTISPKPKTYVLRTATGKYLKMQILGYYSESNPTQGGVYSFKYTLQPGGSKILE